MFHFSGKETNTSIWYNFTAFLYVYVVENYVHYTKSVWNINDVFGSNFPIWGWWENYDEILYIFIISLLSISSCFNWMNENKNEWYYIILIHSRL